MWSAQGSVALCWSVPQIQQRVWLEREGAQNPFCLALFNPWPERGAVELWNEDKESNMFDQIFKITARKGEVYKSVSEHVDKEERGGCELKQRVRHHHPLDLFPDLSHLSACQWMSPCATSRPGKLGWNRKPPPQRVMKVRCSERALVMTLFVCCLEWMEDARDW